MRFDKEKYPAKYKEAKIKFPTLNEFQLQKLVPVWLAVEELTPSLKPGDALSVEAVRLYLSDPEAKKGPSTPTCAKYMRMLEAEAEAPHQAGDAEPGGPAADTLELPPGTMTAVNALSLACNTVVGAFRTALTTAVADESERSRVVLAALRYQHDVSRHQYTAEIEALKRDRQRIEAESAGFEEEVEELRVTATASNAACEAATVKAGCLEHELAVVKVELDHARQQVADSGILLGEVRDALKLALQRVEKSEGESHHHQRLLHEATQRHAAEIAEVRAACAGDVGFLDELRRQHVLDLAEIRAGHEKEIERNGVLTAAVVDALKVVGKPVEGGLQS
jgi:hypothetical protein